MDVREVVGDGEVERAAGALVDGHVRAGADDPRAPDGVEQVVERDRGGDHGRLTGPGDHGVRDGGAGPSTDTAAYPAGQRR